MNHAERKAAKRAEKAQPVYHLTAAQIDQIRRDAVDEANRQIEDIKKKVQAEAVNQALQILLAVPVLVLHDKFGFGRIRLNRFLGYVQTWIRACNEDDNTLLEVYQVAKEEAGYELELR